jgi:putative ABC transport system substrate-binding protein
LVASFNRPGGNVTVVSPSSTVLGAKRLGLLHDLVPGAALIGHLVNPNSPDRDVQLRDAEEAARTLGWQIHVVYAGTERDIDAGFASLVRQKAGALLVSSDPFFDTRRDQIVALAAHHAIPTMYAQRPYVAAGGLMSYARVLPKPIDRRASMPRGFSKAQSRPICQWFSQASSSLSSI